MFDTLAIVIVNYNLKLDTVECIQSLVNAGAQLKQVIVVDNASQDGSVEHLLNTFGPDLTMVVADQNLGYPHGLNLGINAAASLQPEWLLLMNNDTLVAPDFIGELENATHHRNHYGLIGPLIMYYDQPETIWFAGDQLIPGTLFTRHLFRGARAKDQELPPLMQVDILHGCAMMVKQEVFEKIGLFDDASLIYGDDVDFSWRARQAGFALAIATRARMWHKISAVMKRQKPKTRYLRIRNQIRFYRRYARGLTLAIMFIFTTLRCLGIGLRDIFQRQLDLINPLASGWRDGWFRSSQN